MSTSPRPTQAQWRDKLPEATGYRMQGGEWIGPCPLCDDGGDDRFRVMPNGAVFCRQCMPDGADTARYGKLLRDFFPDRARVSRSSTSKPVKAPRLFPPNTPPPRDRDFYLTKKHEHYVYRDADGTERGEVWRLKAARGADKQIGQRTWREDQQLWVNSGKSITSCLWRLPQALEAYDNGYPIHILEGERKTRLFVNATAELGAGAVCNARGSKSFNLSHARLLPTEATVFVWLDNDNEGFAWGSKVVHDLLAAGNVADRIYVVLPTDMGFDKPGGKEDVADFIDNETVPPLAVAEVLQAAQSWATIKQNNTLAGLFPPPRDNTSKRLSKEAKKREAADSDLLNPMDDMALVEHVLKLYRVAITPKEDLLGDKRSSYGKPHILDEDGVWVSGGSTWISVLCAVSELYLEEIKECASLYEDPADVIKAKYRARGLVTSAVATRLQRSFYGVWESLKANNDPLSNDVDIVPFDVWNRAKNVIGTASGVVSLETGKVLEPEEAAKHYITVRTKAPFDPSARHPHVDNILDHLPEQVRAFLVSQIAWSLRYGAGRRILVITGPPASGKSTLLRLLQNALDTGMEDHSYATSPSNEALDRPRFTRDSGAASPELKKWLPPARLALMSDTSDKPKNANVIKQLTGGDSLGWRDVYKSESKFIAQALTIMVFNDDVVPDLSLHEKAMRERVVEVPFTELKNNKSIQYIDEVGDDPEVAKAMLALLVEEATTMNDAQSPPAIPKTLQAASEARTQEEVGEIGVFAKRFIQQEGSEIHFVDAWDEWVRYSLGDDKQGINEKQAGGISIRKFTSRLKGLIPGLPRAKDFHSKISKKTIRGWQGWKLNEPEIDEVDAETARLRPGHLELIKGAGAQTDAHDGADGDDKPDPFDVDALDSDA